MLLTRDIIIAVTIVTALFCCGILSLVLRSRRYPIVTGREAMIGQIGKIVVDREQIWVHVEGERWQVAANHEKFQSGQKVKIVALQGLTLVVTSL